MIEASSDASWLKYDGRKYDLIIIMSIDQCENEKKLPQRKSD